LKVFSNLKRLCGAKKNQGKKRKVIRHAKMGWSFPREQREEFLGGRTDLETTVLKLRMGGQTSGSGGG